MYAQPLANVALQDCHFYHVMDLPGHGRVGGEWDLRGKVDEYLGHADFTGRTVLEVGPASGFLTAEMEQRGAAVLALEMPPEAGWDYVPYPPEMLAPIIQDRVGVMQRLRNSFWFTHSVFRLRARLAYASAYDIPPDLGQFDVAVLACVLLHCHSPLRIVEQCARRADTLIITELHDPALDGLPVCHLLPTAESQNWHTWWRFSPEFFVEFLRVMGFRHFRKTLHTQQSAAGPLPLFTIVASRVAPGAVAMKPAAASAAQPMQAGQAPALADLRASVAQLQEQLAQLGALVRQVLPQMTAAPASATPAVQDIGSAAARAEREIR